MRQSQKIARLEQRINQLEKKAGVFSSRTKDLLEDTMTKVLKLIAEEGVVSPNIWYLAKMNYFKRGTVESVFVKDLSDTGAFSVYVNRKGNKIAVFLKKDLEKVVLGEASFSFYDSRDSQLKLLSEVQRNLESKTIGGHVHDLLTGYNPYNNSLTIPKRSSL